MLDKLDVKEWLSLNAKLQQKKNALRKVLKEKGILKKGAVNKFDNYAYFSEAQYKELFTELLSGCGLELKFNESEYITIEGTKNQAVGRIAKLEFSLFDTETGFFETTAITGEGFDKGDKAGYKAYTGALKYYLADTFMVATGDDPDSETLKDKGNKGDEKKISPNQVKILAQYYTGDNLAKLLELNNIERLEDLSMLKGSKLIEKLSGGAK